MKGSIAILSFFIVGVLIGREHPDVMNMTQGWSLYILMLLMLLVGFNLGSDRNSWKAIKNINRKVIWLPLCTIVGTLICSWLISFVVGMTWKESMAIGSGFGYYSLSSIFITQYLGADLGTIALLANVIRELFTLLLAPLMVRYFGNLAPIAAGGATSMDTTLPIITKYCGESMAVVSIFHGMVVDFCVPFLVTFFCTI